MDSRSEGARAFGVAVARVSPAAVVSKGERAEQSWKQRAWTEHEAIFRAEWAELQAKRARELCDELSPPRRLLRLRLHLLAVRGVPLVSDVLLDYGASEPDSEPCMRREPPTVNQPSSRQAEGTRSQLCGARHGAESITDETPHAESALGATAGLGTEGACRNSRLLLWQRRLAYPAAPPCLRRIDADCGKPGLQGEGEGGTRQLNSDFGLRGQCCCCCYCCCCTTQYSRAAHRAQESVYSVPNARINKVVAVVSRLTAPVHRVRRLRSYFPIWWSYLAAEASSRVEAPWRTRSVRRERLTTSPCCTSAVNDWQLRSFRRAPSYLLTVESTERAWVRRTSPRVG